MTPLAIGITRKAEPLIVLKRTGNKDEIATVDSVDAYSDFIWALAKKFTASSEEAEAAAREIFIDIWRHKECKDQAQSAEELLIGLIARRHLVKYLQAKPNKNVRQA